MSLSQRYNISSGQPVLIAGPTASGKSGLALQIAAEQGGVIINADALQVFAGWRILTARPGPADEAQAPHALYGHVPYESSYSVGDWMRDLKPLLAGPERPIIVGGTGLYFRALTEGLADIPATPPEIRDAANAVALETLLADLSEKTKSGIDIQNRARVQRAWEVQRATGRAIDDWQADTPPPLVPLRTCRPLVLNAEPDWLTPRIERRFEQMLDQGLLDEARTLQPHYHRDLPSSKAIGAPEIMAHLNGDMTLEETRENIVIATRQYAKRQRTWFRARMSDWRPIAAASL